MKPPLFIGMVVLVLAGCSLGEDGTSSAQPPAFESRVSNDASAAVLTGHVVATDGSPVFKAHVRVGNVSAITDSQGSFRLPVLSGESKISISASGYAPFSVSISIFADTDMKFDLELSDTTTVSAQADTPASAVATQIYDANDFLQATPGEPGVPVVL